jgi:glycerophosphoryl diester phosphodiesterase
MSASRGEATMTDYSSEMRRLLEAGVDRIITDYPERLSAVLGTRRDGSGN